MFHKTPKGFDYTQDHIINPDDFIPSGEYNPYNVRAFLVQGRYGVYGVALASSADDALDICADAGKLRACEIDEDPTGDYGEDHPFAHLGNEGTLHDLQYVNYEVFDLPFDPRTPH